MTLKSSEKAIIEKRRREVARLLVKGLTQREIMAELAAIPFTNPETGEAFSLGTINADIKDLRASWMVESMEDTRLLRGRILAEMRELRRIGWERGDHGMVQRSLAQEVALLGLQRPPMTQANVHHQIEHIRNPVWEHFANLVNGMYGPNVTPEEKAIAGEMLKAWMTYVKTLKDRTGKAPKDSAGGDAPDEEEAEDPGGDAAPVQDDEDDEDDEEEPGDPAGRDASEQDDGDEAS